MNCGFRIREDTLSDLHWTPSKATERKVVYATERKQVGRPPAAVILATPLVHWTAVTVFFIYFARTALKPEVLYPYRKFSIHIITAPPCRLPFFKLVSSECIPSWCTYWVVEARGGVLLLVLMYLNWERPWDKGGMCTYGGKRWGSCWRCWNSCTSASL